jgi:hypothetical protein
VAPGRLGAPVPFELSRVVMPLPGRFARFTVFAPCHPPASQVLSAGTVLADDPGRESHQRLIIRCRAVLV